MPEEWKCSQQFMMLENNEIRKIQADVVDEQTYAQLLK